MDDIHNQRSVGDRQELDRLPTTVNQPMPCVERRCEQAPWPPLETLLAPALLPYFGGAMAVENANDFLVKMFFRFESASRRNLAYIHAGDAFHAVQIDKRRLAAGTEPRRQRNVADILHAVPINDGNILAHHPFEVRRLMKCRHQGTYSFILRHG